MTVKSILSDERVGRFESFNGIPVSTKTRAQGRNRKSCEYNAIAGKEEFSLAKSLFLMEQGNWFSDDNR